MKRGKKMIDVEAQRLAIDNSNSKQQQQNQQQQQYSQLLKDNNDEHDLRAGDADETDCCRKEGKVFCSDDHLTSNNNNSNSNNNQHKQDITSKSNKQKMNYCFKDKWVLFSSMCIALFITAIAIAMLMITLLDNDDQCFNNQLQFPQTSYNLFATKTTYSTAYNFLNNSKLQNGNSNSNINNNNYEHRYPEDGYADSDDEDEDEDNGTRIPRIFSRRGTLKTLNELLTSREVGCKVRQFHYFGRHAARYPSSDEIELINKHLIAIQTRIDLSKFSLNSNAPIQNSNNNNNQNVINNQQQQQQNNTNNSTMNHHVCFNPLAQYKQWVSFMVPEQGNLIMDSGIDETLAIAQRLSAIYPEMFDANVAKIELGSTSETRTAQTALAFAKQIKNFKITSACDQQRLLADLPAALRFPSGNREQNIARVEAADSNNNNECYKSFIKTYNRDKLQFHKTCQSLHKEELQQPYNLNLHDANRTKFIAHSVSKKLKLAKEQQLSPEETQSIYKLCRYEAALTASSSIWCSLFSEKELRYYEYLDDVDDFFNQACGHPDQMRSACPVTSELMKSFKRAYAASANSPNGAPQKPEANFYFTHSQVIQRLLAASVELELDPEYSVPLVREHLAAGTVPKRRQWRSSLFSPFSANLAFALYECPKGGSSGSGSSASDESGYIMFDAGGAGEQQKRSSFKVVASLNERPIILDGCRGSVCDLSELVADGRLDKEKRCRMEEICKVNRVYT